MVLFMLPVVNALRSFTVFITWERFYTVFSKFHQKLCWNCNTLYRSTRKYCNAAVKNGELKGNVPDRK